MHITIALRHRDPSSGKGYNFFVILRQKISTFRLEISPFHYLGRGDIRCHNRNPHSYYNWPKLTKCSYEKDSSENLLGFYCLKKDSIWVMIAKDVPSVLSVTENFEGLILQPLVALYSAQVCPPPLKFHNENYSTQFLQDRHES